ncbi:MAG: hypothetical protein KAH17_02320, partial [Bacteroidales bacterium]|nr:hypothetical protein [Bacteroidales bacterium]
MSYRLSFFIRRLLIILVSSFLVSSTCIFGQTGSIGDRVWDDVNSNGVYDQGEQGYRDIVIELYQADGTTLIDTKTSNNSGYYYFTSLSAGNYKLKFYVPTGYFLSPKDLGGDESNDSDVEPTTGFTDIIPLLIDEEINNVDAGIYLITNNSSIGDRIFLDANANGILDSGEGGYGGLVVELRSGNNDNLLDTRTTSATGYFAFSGLSPGLYYLAYTAPSGYLFSPKDVGSNEALDSDVDQSTGFSDELRLSGGESYNNIDAGVYPISHEGSIGDRAWLDLNANGILESGEYGLSGVTIELYASDGSTLLDTKTTSSTGYYVFRSLAADTYYLKYITPSGYYYSPKDQGSEERLDSDADPSTGMTDAIVLNNGQTINNQDAGMYTNTGTSELGDRAWIDLDADGILDSGELGFAGITVELYEADGTTLVDTKTTGATGYYVFRSLLAGTYYVKYINPTGFNFSPQNQGSDERKDSDVNPSTGFSDPIVLGTADRQVNWDAGLVSNTGTSELGDRVWVDANSNGVLDPTELGYAGMTIELFEDNGTTLIDTKTSGATGYFIFRSLSAGSYKLKYTAPAGYFFSPKDQGTLENRDSDIDPSTGFSDVITLGSSERRVDVDAGIYQTTNNSSIGDRIFLDANANGLLDSGETGYADQTVELYASDGTTLLESRITSANGFFAFSNLSPGQYFLKFTTPTGYFFSPKDIGTDETIDSDVYSATGFTDIITLVSDESHTDIDAGLYPISSEGSIGDRAWLDANGNGVFDTGDTGFGGITVELHQSDGTYLENRISSANGYFVFHALAEGNYRLKYIAPSGYVFTSKDQGANDALDSDVDPVSGYTDIVTITTNDNFNIWDAGLTTGSSTGIIGDRAWNDVNGNGILDTGELGIASVTVNLMAADGYTQIASLTTSATGYFAFRNLPVGNYILEYELPASYSFSPKNQGSNEAHDSDVDQTTGQTDIVSLSAGQTINNQDAGMYSFDGSDIGDYVWYDVDNDGIQDSGEPGAEGVTVNILLDSDLSLVRTTTTDVYGNYIFQDLQENRYVIQVIAPTNYNITLRDQGVDNAIDSDADPSTGITGGINAPLGSINLWADVGLTSSAQISGFVWLDDNKDGLQDGGESGLDIQVDLYTSAESLLASTQSSNGNYAFSNIPGGDYYIFVHPETYGYTLKDVGGDDNADSDIDAVTGKTDVFTFSAAQSITNLDAGLTDLRGAGFNGTVWVDSDGDGLKETGEPLFDEIATAYLHRSSDDVRIDQISFTNGIYEFNQVPAGQYYILFQVDVDYILGPAKTGDNDVDPVTHKTSVILLSADQRIDDLDAAVYQDVSIGDRLWYDSNTNGILDIGENGVPGATVELYNDSDFLMETRTTSATGYFVFRPYPGRYYLKYYCPSGYVFTMQDFGSNDSKDSDVDPSTGETEIIDLYSGININSLDAGITSDIWIGGRVWLDKNIDGLQLDETSDPGYALCEVNKLDGTGTYLNDAVTNSKGQYLFNISSPGDYILELVSHGEKTVSPKDQGSDDALDSDFDPVTFRTDVMSLTVGQFNNNIDCGAYTPRSISGQIWFDTNANGIRDGADGPFQHHVEIDELRENRTVTLHRTGVADQSTLTDANGVYTFADLEPGYYSLEFPDIVMNFPWEQAWMPYHRSPYKAGSDLTKNSDAYVGTGQTMSYDLTSTGSIENIDAGYYHKPAVFFSWWKDLNGDGVKGVGDDYKVWMDHHINVEIFTSPGVSPNYTSGGGDDYATGWFMEIDPGQHYLYSVKSYPSQNTPILTLKDQGSSEQHDNDFDPATYKTDILTLDYGTLLYDEIQLGYTGLLNQDPINLSLSFSTDNETPAVNETITVTLTVYESVGGSSAINVVISEIIDPSYFTYISHIASIGVYQNGDWSIPTITKGYPQTLSIQLTALASGDIDASVTEIDPSQYDTDPGNNSAYISFPVSESGGYGATLLKSSTTGANGGIESDGKLSEKIALRSFLNTKENPNRYRKPNQLTQLKEREVQAGLIRVSSIYKSGLSDILDYMPEKGPDNSDGFIVTPEDLLFISNAIEVFSVDYIKPGLQRVGAIMAMTTPSGQVYENSKTTCDRLTGGMLEEIKVVNIQGHPFIMSLINQSNGE